MRLAVLLALLASDASIANGQNTVPQLPPHVLQLLGKCIMTQTGDMASASTIKLGQFHTSLTQDGNTTLLQIPMTGMGLFPTAGNHEYCITTGGKYCAIRSQLGVIGSYCVQDTCTAGDLLALSQTLNPLFQLIPQVSSFCEGDDDSYNADSSAKTTAGVFIAIGCLSVLITAACRAYEIMHQADEHGIEETKVDSEEKPMLVRLLFCWDLHANLSELLKTTERPTSFFNGMKVFSILWVMLGHIPLIEPGIDNITYFQGEYHRLYEAIFMANFVMGVETFLFISGFLAAFLSVRSWPHAPSILTSLKTTLWAYADRWMRITPVYLSCIFFSAYLAQHIADGPLAQSLNHGGWFNQCKGTSWWRNIVYINNFEKADMNCYLHAWYLGTEMQCLWVGMLIIAAYVHKRVVGWALVAAAFVGIVVAIGVVFSQADANQRLGSYTGYYEPGVRGFPFLMGIATAFVLANPKLSARTKTFLQARSIRWGVYAASAVFMLGAVHFVWYTTREMAESGGIFMGKVDWGGGMLAFYGLTWHVGWALGMVGLTVAFYHGHGGIVNKFLSHPFFEPLSKLALGIYLIHPTVIGIINVSSGQVLHFTPNWLLGCLASSAFWSYFASAIGYVLIERPVFQMWNLLSGRGMRREFKQPKLTSEPANEPAADEVDKAEQ